jgi:hypothetical protein
MLTPGLRAQSFDATNLPQPTDLGGKWLIHAGDDPAYAGPDFDDSSWTRFDVSTPLQVVIKNHPDVVWYRLHVKAAPTETGLALAEWNISSAFEIYVNGERLMRTGHVAPYSAYTFSARLLAPIPDRMVSTGALVIALRVHISKSEWGDGYPGYYTENLTLGRETALREHIWLSVIGQNALNWIRELLGLGLGIVALALFSAQRRHWEYLWIFLQFFSTTCALPLIWYELFHNVPAHWDLLRQPLSIAATFFSILMYLAFLRLRFGWWIRVACIVVAAGQVLAIIGQTNGNLSRLAGILALFPLLILIAGVLPVLLIVHWRRGNREAGILLIPAILQSLSIYAQVMLFFLGQIPALLPATLRIGRMIFAYPAGPFQLDFGQLAGLLFLLSLTIIMVLRSTWISRQQAQLEGEMAAAREVQEVILPDQIEAVPGFAVESAYEPAQQVGGDFFQILPSGDGGMLLVMGDVAGKGLPAAMLVSMLVGATRSTAAFTHDPAELLANLNERLVGRAADGFATAFVAHIAADGWIRLANAGHLYPYLDGREIELAGALPLGIKSHVHYETKEFLLPAGSRITFYSDGVIEAQNQSGELFGFERSRELSMQPALAIVEAAKKFGQKDDITVVAITRDAAIANAA